MSADQTAAPSEKSKFTPHFFACAGILIVIALVGLNFSPSAAVAAWIIVMVLLAAFAVIAGHGITGLWLGILIDARCKISLSRLQLLAWSLVVLSGLLTAVMLNIGRTGSPLNIEIPSQLWILMGISTTSMVAAPGLLSQKTKRKAATEESEQAAEALRALGADAVSDEPDGVVVYNTDPRGARWGDLFRGEEVGNASSIDVGKLQMFFFTFILVLSYGAAIAAIFRSETFPITELPPVADGMNMLLGISHSGYLLYKVLPHSREASAPTTPPKKKAAKKAKKKAGGGAQ